MKMDELIHSLNLTARCEVYYPLSPYDYVDFVVLMLSMFTLIFSLISWNNITDFKSFKNYLFICIIINNLMNAFLRNLNIECVMNKFSNPYIILSVFVLAQGLYNYFELTVNFWLMLLFYDTYLNLVKIYNNHILRRYLKANLWGWGMPLLICLFIYSNVPGLKPVFLLAPLVFNGIIYLIIFFSLLKTKMVSTIGEKRCRFSRLLTFLFIICILSLLTSVMPITWLDKSSLQINKLWYSFKDLTVILYFLTGRRNRLLWKEYYGKDESKSLLNTYI